MRDTETTSELFILESGTLKIEANMPSTMHLLRTTPPDVPIHIAEVRNWHMALTAAVEYYSAVRPGTMPQWYADKVAAIRARHMATGVVLLLLRKHNVNAARLRLESFIGKKSEPWCQDAAREATATP